MKFMYQQKGMGLVEVLVALLILAIGVMGFIALQYRAVEATAESFNRVKAINIARDLAERMRVNRGASNVYAFHLTNAQQQSAFKVNCFNESCSSADLADFDVAQLSNQARSQGMSINYLPCQGNKDERQCIYIAWNDTAPTNGDLKEGNCTSGNVYDPDSTCLIMEVY